jgi:4-hydroxyphenylpyruvate dioxygenase-like putative hemolysin
LSTAIAVKEIGAVVQQFLDHVDHVVWVCEKQNLEKYVDEFSRLFRAKFEGPYERPNFLRTYVSWETGLELTSPLSDETRSARHLQAHGEGFYAMVFGVDDVDEARTRARSLGYEPSEDYPQLGDEPWAYQLEDGMVECYVGELLNTTMLFGRIVTRPGVVNVR